MHKEYVIIAIGLVAALVIVLLPLAFLITDDYRNIAVEELKTRASEVEARYHQQRTKSTPAPETNTAPDSIEVLDTASPSGDSIAAYKQFSEKQSVIDAKPILKLLLKSHQNKSVQEEEDEIAAFCADNQEFILELRNLAATGGPFYDLDFSKGSGIEVPHLEQIRGWVWLLQKHASLAAANGDYEEATKDALAIAAFAEGIGKEPILISQMVRAALDNRLYDLIAGNIQGENLSPEQVARIIEYAARFNGRNDLADAMALESTSRITEIFDPLRNGSYSDSFVARMYGSIGRPLLNREEEIYVDVMERLSTIASLPYYEAQPELERIQEEVENISYARLMVRPTLQILAPAYYRMPETCARYEAQLGLIQIGLTVEQYHGQHGEYPQTLEEIAPALGGTLPLDPYTGQNYVYKPSGDGFTLYSARGSIMPPAENRTPRGVDLQGNIVWRDTKE